MKETAEHNNRFYGEELKTESEQLKEWLLIANESNDYFREENVRLINREKELLREIHHKNNEIEKLISQLQQKENIIKEVREHIKGNCILSDEWEELENHNFVPIGRIKYKSLSSKEVKELLEILEEENI